VDDGPPPAALAKYMTKLDPSIYTNSMDTIPVPDAMTVGLGWNSDNSTDYDLVAAAYDGQGQCLGIVQGTTDRTALFGKAITHTGDNDGTQVDTVLGDSENIVFDLRAVPAHCNQILFGALLVTAPENINTSRPYVHMLPLMREEEINSQVAEGRTRTIEYDSDDDSDSDVSSSSSGGTEAYGSRGIGADDSDDGRHDFVTMFMAELPQYPEMMHKKGFVAGRLFRASNGKDWFFTPYRTVVDSDPQHGIYPAFDYYSKFPVLDPVGGSGIGSSNNNAQLPPCFQQQPAGGGFDPYQQQMPQSQMQMMPAYDAFSSGFPQQQPSFFPQ